MLNEENKIIAALPHIDNQDRELWVSIAIAIKSELGENGFYIFNDWSSTASNYKEADAKAVWRSIRPNGGVTIATLYHHAQQGGWKPSQPYKPPCPIHEASKLKARQLAQEVERAATQKKQKQAATLAKRIWQEAQPAVAEHPYLKAKCLPPIGVKQQGLSLLVPIYADKELINLQFIAPTGQKRFLKGGKTASAYSPINGNLNKIYICEGWATGATLNYTTDFAVACAMNAGNLKAVALTLRERYPNTSLVIAADNDRNQKQNIGLVKAKEAALASDASYITPEFLPHEKGTDFNDRFVLDLASKAFSYA